MNWHNEILEREQDELAPIFKENKTKMKKHLEKIIRYCELLEHAEDKARMILNNNDAYYQFFGTRKEKEKDVKNALEVCKRLENRIKELYKKEIW